MQALILTLRSLVVSVLGMTSPNTSAITLSDFGPAPSTQVTKMVTQSGGVSTEPLMFMLPAAASLSVGTVQFYPSSQDD